VISVIGRVVGLANACVDLETVWGDSEGSITGTEGLECEQGSKTRSNSSKWLQTTAV
jgi:hypothetical protein